MQFLCELLLFLSEQLTNWPVQLVCSCCIANFQRFNLP